MKNRAVRRCGAIFLTGCLLCAQSSIGYSEGVSLDEKYWWQAQVFIVNQIKGIGLVDSYQEDADNKSYAYDNVLAAMASMAMGNWGLAREILDTLSEEVEIASEGGIFEYYDYSDTSGKGFSLAYCGNSAWLLQALNMYQKAMYKPECAKNAPHYYEAQKKLASYLVSLQDSSDGGLKGADSVSWKSTEHNMIAYAALKNFIYLNKKRDSGIKWAEYEACAEKIKSFVQGEMWQGDHFVAGKNESGVDASKVTDIQAFGILLFKNGYRAYKGALTWAEDNLKLTKDYESEEITGFDFGLYPDENTADLDTVWLEGTLQMALAFSKGNDKSKGEYYLNEALKTQQSGGALLLAAVTGTALWGWQLQPWRAIAPTAWLIFYHKKFNPLVIYKHNAHFPLTKERGYP